ncbi:MAG: ABC transporter ATP-binding protein [Defluviitaleaceae bacterium]|nr:ABC transporter ATP-binding protein [Defluviitaleaceae bacterium]MCL2238834.1 ABC transporter ATP-binding protein [Defluviitaleaceae bacterium]
MNHFIDLVGVTKTFGRKTVLSNINLYIDRNEFVTLLGPSGCGKTTTLRIIGGFEKPTAGALLFNGEDAISLPPNKRKVNTVFQKYALFPNMNVFDNIAFGLRLKKTDAKTIAEKVDAMLALVNLAGFQKRTIQSLSGGQQQRVAIARAVVNDPEVLLLDEPLGALDLKLRLEMQVELKNIQKELGITFVYVTHDQGEALSMSDTVVVMDAGQIQQIGKPEDIYNEPKNAFVAKFIGESNILEGIMHSDYHVEFAQVGFACIDKGFGPGEAVDVVVRPEDVAITPLEEGTLRGKVRHITFKGVHYEMRVEANGFAWKVHNTVQFPVGTEVGLSIAPHLIHVMKKSGEPGC